jgi:CheY-like chemotaxis protein
MSRKVLVVDDEPDVLLATRLLLQTAGYSVLEARTGEEALALVEEAEPDAMFLDLRMPDMDGWDVLEELGARGHLERVPVIVLSAHGSPGRVERSVELGAKAYVRKPFRKADLTRALDAVLDARPAP